LSAKAETVLFCHVILRDCTKNINFADYSPNWVQTALKRLTKKLKRYYGKKRRPQGAGEAPAGKG
jgi:hypothetical protein